MGHGLGVITGKASARVLLNIFLWTAFIAQMPRAESETMQHEVEGFKYYLFVPDGIDQKQALPLIVSLHPSTGRGGMMIDLIKEQAQKKGYIVAAPNSKDSKSWFFDESEDIFKMIQQIKTTHAIDEKRIYLTGFSAGAGLVYYMGLNYPDKFRAIAAFAGPLRGPEQDVKIDISPDANRHIPVLILHGTLDGTLDISESIYARDKLLTNGYTVKFRELGGVGHEYPAHASWIMIDFFEKNK